MKTSRKSVQRLNCRKEWHNEQGIGADSKSERTKGDILVELLRGVEDNGQTHGFKPAGRERKEE